MTVGSFCSGISADSVAWHPLGWRHRWFTEIDPFCCKVLKHHYAEVVNHGDFTECRDFEPVDLAMVSTPCQDFSVAGLRAGMDGARGNLTLSAIETLGAMPRPPRWLVFENVPGLLSSDERRAFGYILARLAAIGYGTAYGVLDAQYVGLAQRRERVFLVGYLGDWRPSAAVLFDASCLSGHPAPSRKTGQDIAGTLGGGAGERGWCPDTDRMTFVPFGGNNTAGPIDIATACNAHGGSGRMDFESETFIAHSLRADGFDPSEDGTGRGTPLVPVLAFDTTQITSAANRSNPKPGDPCHPLASGAHPPTIAFSCKDHGADAGEIAPTLRSMGHDKSHPNAGGQVAVAVNFRGRDGSTQIEVGSEVATAMRGAGGSASKLHTFTGMAVRRLTPRECEILQGFSPDYTLIPEHRKRQKETGEAAAALYRYYCRTERGRMYVEMRGGRVYATPDGPRYRALGNSIAVPCLAWLGKRIEMVEEILRERAA